MSAGLGPRELRGRFEAYVVPDYLAPQLDGAAGPLAGPPRFVSVGGAPGSGKSSVLAEARRSVPGSVVVNGDELRQFHPLYAALMREDPLGMPAATAPASGAWTGMSTEYLRALGASAVVETTLRDAAMLRAEFEAFKAAGYATELWVLAVPPEVSRAGILSRYVAQVALTGAGRWTPTAAHDTAAANMRATVRSLAESAAVDRVLVRDRAGRVLLDARGAGADRGEEATRAVDAARGTRALSSGEAGAWVESTARALRERARLGQDDPDVMRAAARLAARDAAAVVPLAFPGDPARQRAALARLAAAAGAAGMGPMAAPGPGPARLRPPTAGRSADGGGRESGWSR